MITDDEMLFLSEGIQEALAGKKHNAVMVFDTGRARILLDDDGAALVLEIHSDKMGATIHSFNEQRVICIKAAGFVQVVQAIKNTLIKELANE